MNKIYLGIIIFIIILVVIFLILFFATNLFKSPASQPSTTTPNTTTPSTTTPSTTTPTTTPSTPTTTSTPTNNYTDIIPPNIDLKPKGKVTPMSNSVSVLHKGNVLMLSYILEPKDIIVDKICEIMDPLELLKYTSNTVLNLFYDTYPNDKYKNISLTFKAISTNPAIAYATGEGITYNLESILDFYKNNNDITSLKNEIIGVTLHEMTHVFQYGIYPSLLYIESMAEYSRISSGFIVGWPKETSSESSTFNVSYGVIPAYFWLNTEQKYPGFMKELNLNFKTSADANLVAKKMTNGTHQTIDSIWVTYQNNLKKGEKTKNPVYPIYIEDEFLKDCTDGLDSSYKLYPFFDLTKNNILSTCEGVVSPNGNVKGVLESTGLFVRYDKIKGKISESNSYSDSIGDGLYPWTINNDGMIVDKTELNIRPSDLEMVLPSRKNRGFTKVGIKDDSNYDGLL